MVSFLGLAYLCGFLVVEAFFFRIGIHDLNMELLRLRYIQTGLLFLAFPLFVLVPSSMLLWMHFQQRKHFAAITRSTPKDRPSVSHVGRNHLSHTVQVLCVGMCFYTFLLFETSEAFHRRLWQMTILLALTILPGLLLPREFGFTATKEHRFWRWIFALGSVGLLVGMLWGPELYQPMVLAMKNGASYWVLTVALCLCIFQSLLEQDQPLFPGQDKGLIIARSAIILILAFLGTYAFAYRLFPLIPAEKGGGNYFYARNAKLCFPAGVKLDAIKQVLAQSLVNDCSLPVKVIEATDSMLYVTLSSNQKGESWADVENFPAIYSVQRSDLALFEYIANESSK